MSHPLGRRGPGQRARVVERAARAEVGVPGRGLQRARRRARPHAQDEAPRRPPEEPRARRAVLRLIIGHDLTVVLHCLYILHLSTNLKYILVRIIIKQYRE